MIIAKGHTRKEEIILTASKLFKKKGYTASSMRDLAQLLGIEAASLYSHIKSKEEILQELCFRLARQFIDRLDEVEHDYSSYKDQLQHGIIAHTEIITADLNASAVFLNEYRHLSEPWLTNFKLLRSSYINRFKRIIRQGVAHGEFRKVDERIAVMTIFSSVNWIPKWYDPEGERSAHEIGQQVADQLINGL